MARRRLRHSQFRRHVALALLLAGSFAFAMGDPPPTAAPVLPPPPEPVLLTMEMPTAYGQAPWLRLTGQPNLRCDVQSSDAVLRFVPLGPSGTALFTGGPLRGPTIYQGQCFDDFGGSAPIFALTLAPASYPAPRLWGPASISRGTAAMLLLENLFAELFCDVYGSDGYYQTVAAGGATALALSPYPVVDPYRSVVTYSGTCRDNSGAMFWLGSVDVTVTGPPLPVDVSPTVAPLGETPTIGISATGTPAYVVTETPAVTPVPTGVSTWVSTAVPTGTSTLPPIGSPTVPYPTSTPVVSPPTYAPTEEPVPTLSVYPTTAPATPAPVGTDATPVPRVEITPIVLPTIDLPVCTLEGCDSCLEAASAGSELERTNGGSDAALAAVTDSELDDVFVHRQYQVQTAPLSPYDRRTAAGDDVPEGQTTPSSDSYYDWFCRQWRSWPCP